MNETVSAASTHSFGSVLSHYVSKETELQGLDALSCCVVSLRKLYAQISRVIDAEKCAWIRVYRPKGIDC